jgi:hypothetical protein
MLRTMSAIGAAAAIAAAITVFTAPGAELAAGPLAKPDEAALNVCAQRPWPYFNCVGTRLGNQRIRLVTTDRLAGN